MRHERIPIEQKLANDAQCRPATPAFEGALMGTARSSGNGKTGTTAGFDPSSPQHGHHGGNDMDWLMGGGGLDDPLSSLMVSPSADAPTTEHPSLPSRSSIDPPSARDAAAPRNPPPARAHESHRPGENLPPVRKSPKRTRFLSDAPPLLPVLPNRRSSRRATAPGVTSTSAMTCSACPPPTPAAWAAATANTRAGSARSRRSPCTRSSAALTQRATATLTPVTRTTGRITPAGARTRARARTSSTAGATA